MAGELEEEEEGGCEEEMCEGWRRHGRCVSECPLRKFPDTTMHDGHGSTRDPSLSTTTIHSPSIRC
jgi:hypothetical protein